MLCASLKRWVNRGHVGPSLTAQGSWAVFSLPPGPRLSHVQSWATLSLRSLVVLKLHISRFLPLKKTNAPSGIVFSVLYLERGTFSDKRGSSGQHARRVKGQQETVEGVDVARLCGGEAWSGRGDITVAYTPLKGGRVQEATHAYSSFRNRIWTNHRNFPKGMFRLNL